MKEKILCVLTTYNRPEKLLRFLDQFDEHFKVASEFFEIYVADDFPDSELFEYVRIKSKTSPINISYHKNPFNLGQGSNLINAIKDNDDYLYYWFPGDDDLIVRDEFIEVLLTVIKNRPAIAILEFRQGRNLSAGTFLEGECRIENCEKMVINALINFGKCTSSIVGNPGKEFINFLNCKMQSSMYQDKAIGIYSFLLSSRRDAYIHTKIAAMGDEDYGCLRYSTRVFSNLDKTVNRTIDFYNSNKGDYFYYRETRSISPLYWWWYGIKCHISWRSDLKYKTRKFLSELFFGFFIAIYYEYYKNDFQPK